MRIHEEVRKNAAQSDPGLDPAAARFSPRAELTLGEPAQSTDPRIGEGRGGGAAAGIDALSPGRRSQILRELLAEREKAQRAGGFARNRS